MSHKKFYLTLDTETATLPFANDICKNADEKLTIAISKPLVYDLGWVITDRQGNIFKKANYLINEIFFNTSVFDTAYYKDKKQLYLDKIKSGEIVRTDWNSAIDELLKDIQLCDVCTAFNACFDFKKAIPFTERYIDAFYSNDFYKWQKYQEKQSKMLISDNADTPKNPDYTNPIVRIRNIEFLVTDLRYLACSQLINNRNYKNFCIDNELFSKSGLFFSTTAETVYKYLVKDIDFIEQHTALDDSIIESYILTKLLQKGKLQITLDSFAEKKLGMIHKYSASTNRQPIIKNQLEIYINNNGGFDNPKNNFTKGIIKNYYNFVT